MAGRLLRGLNGAVNFGYQFRVPHGGLNQDTFHGVSASGATSYDINRKVSLSGQVSKDFSTTATDSSVDTVAASLAGKYAFNRRLGFTLGTGWGRSRFLGDAGRVILELGPPTLFGKNRQDDFFHWEATVNYDRSDRFKISFSYNWFKNWSTTPYADFVRGTWSVDLNSRL
jgi:long-subunit fatty acid transport protein